MLFTVSLINSWACGNNSQVLMHRRTLKYTYRNRCFCVTVSEQSVILSQSSILVLQNVQILKKQMYMLRVVLCEGLVTPSLVTVQLLSHVKNSNQIQQPCSFFHFALGLMFSLCICIYTLCPCFVLCKIPHWFILLDKPVHWWCYCTLPPHMSWTTLWSFPWPQKHNGCQQRYLDRDP